MLCPFKKACYICTGQNIIPTLVRQQIHQGALAHLARARHWQCRGDRFESGNLHNYLIISSLSTKRAKTRQKTNQKRAKYKAWPYF